MAERIQKILSSHGVCSRREAERLMLAGRVLCNGKPVQPGDTADPSIDKIEIDGTVLPAAPKMRYLMLNKPRGYVTTCDDEKGRKDVTMLVADCGDRVYPVGRLDMDSEGLLLLTNDGDFANRLMHPSHEVDKTYRVWVEGVQPDSVERLSRPIELDGYLIRRPQVECLQQSGSCAVYEIVIHEGRNRQIRRMCEIAGLRVTRLKRVAEGLVCLGSLPLGKWRELTEEEIKALDGK